MNKNEHFKTSEIEGYLNRSLPAVDLDRLESHLLFCDDCCNLLPPPTVEEFWSAIMTDGFGQEKITESKTKQLWSSILAFPKLSYGLLGTTGLLVVLSVIFLSGVNEFDQASKEYQVFNTVHTAEIFDRKQAFDKKKTVEISDLGDNSHSTSAPGEEKSADPISSRSATKSLYEGKKKLEKNSDRPAVKNSLQKNIRVVETRGNSAECTEENKVQIELGTKKGDLEFKWKRVPKAVKYHLYISDEDEILIEEFETEIETSYLLKKSLDPLKRYKWKIIVTTNTGQTIVGPSGKFTIKDFQIVRIKLENKKNAYLRCSANS